ncbi:Panacea domain-containing protein [Corynebacterium pygosceleis]|uniref:Panacea domain-containing protein n=1 Tax=Corynebacterium pygosceleis TaxID=2800406 RepID=UPI0020068AAC|nr:type II toxin-antitoxin system antitoxin SocA domain-containing protein [Corynebacterium pygosceleis]MCK7675910.1 DUF4065 domain-containing protein [Corynebacterium pygosceleis]
MVYNPTVLANNVLNRAFAEGLHISPMKLQKILFFIACEYRKKTGENLFDMPFQTWKYGPVNRLVHDMFRPFNRGGIRRYARNAAGVSEMVDEAHDEDLRRVIEKVWEATRGWGAVELARITHAEGSAWDRAFQAGRAELDYDDMAADMTYRHPLGL